MWVWPLLACSGHDLPDSVALAKLSDVYRVIGYYLKHAAELCQYFATREREEQALRADHPEWSPAGLRERLMARRTGR